MILITGCARSGTSLTTRIFQACGAELGNVNKLYENTAVRDGITKPYLKSVGADPMGQYPLPDINALKPDPTFGDRVRDALGPDVNCYKGAKMCLFWPIWAEAFPDATWVIVRRERERIIDSCIRTSFMRAHHSREGWGEWVDHHLERFEEMRLCLDDITEVWPSEFIDGYGENMKHAVEGAGLVWDWQKAEACLNANRWHG